MTETPRPQTRSSGSSTETEMCDHVPGILLGGNDRLRRATSTTEAFEILTDICRGLGFDNVSVIDDVREDRPFYDNHGCLLSHSVLGWPDIMLNDWFEKRVWRHFPDAQFSIQAMLPFPSITFDRSRQEKEDRWVGHIRASTGGMDIAGAAMVPVHGFGHASLMGWSCHDAALSEMMLRDHWSSLLAFCYAFIDAVRRFDGRRLERTELTLRQKDCLHWIAQGKTVSETAIILGLSPHTVEEHLQIAAERMGVKGRAQLIVKACQMGIL